MYATCRRYAGGARSGSGEDVVPAGRRLARRLSRLPGFVSFLVLDAGAGGLVAVSVFETEADLSRADREAAGWLGAPPAAGDGCSGEVLVQSGL